MHALLSLLLLWMVWPPKDTLRLGKDLRGGVSLSYAVKLPRDANAEQVLKQVIEVLKQRVNPNGVLDISFARVFDHWARAASVPVEQVNGRFRMDEAYARHERGEISAREYFAYLGKSLDLPLNETQFLAVFAGLACGIAVGLVPLSLPGLPQPVRLGLAGGPLLIAILGVSIEPWVILIALGAFCGGIATLVLRMQDRPRQDDGWDDGAVV